MKTEKVYFFKPGFWPDRKHRQKPDDSFPLADDPSIADIYRYRQEVRLCYRNSIDVWGTYSYFNRWMPIAAPIIGLLAHSWIVTVALLVFYFAFARFIGREKHSMLFYKIVVPGQPDGMITEHYGPPIPFEGD
jgi:hypothetical protein